MASIKEAFDSTIKESFAGLKIFGWALPVCISYTMTRSFSGVGLTVAAITIILFIGYLAEISNNIIIKNNTVLPGANFLKHCLVGIILSITLLPYAGLALLVWNLGYALATKIPNTVFSLTAQVILNFLAVACVMSSYVLFIRRLNPLDAFNLKKYFIGFCEVFISFAYLTIKIFICSALIIGFLAYCFSLIIGLKNVIWTYTISVLFVLALFIGANYMAQTSEEIFTFMEKEENQEKEKKDIEKLKYKL